MEVIDLRNFRCPELLVKVKLALIEHADKQMVTFCLPNSSSIADVHLFLNKKGFSFKQRIVTDEAVFFDIYP